MHPQLEAIQHELRDASGRLHRLAARLGEEEWRTRPASGGWSAGECVAHLNLTSEAFLPPIRAGLEEARALGGRAPRRFRRGFFGWLLWSIMPPPARVRVKTSPAFVPTADQPGAALVARFDELQEALLASVREADGLAIDRVRVPSPFDARVGYTLFAALGIVARHQHRHLWQAEEAVRSPGAAR